MTISRRRFAQTITLALLAVLGWLGGCSDNPPTGADPQSLSEGPIVSDPVVTAGLASGATSGPALLVNGAEDSVAFVSVPPGTALGGTVATIRRVGDAGPIFATVRDGGFDPVPVAAQVGDSLDIRVTDAGGATLLVLRVAVARTRPPIVVRTDPPRKKTDVPLNSAIIIVFSEPVAEATLSGSAVQLFRGTSAVPGTVRLLQGTGAAAAFIPAAPLARNTDYRLVVTRAVRDLEGDALEAGVTVPFRTGQSSTGPAASVTVSPDTVYLAGATYQMTATVRDAAGSILIDQPITWATSAPQGLAVSPTGLLTALAVGEYTVSATVNGLEASAQVKVTGGPAASVEVAPPQATVGAAGDTIVLAATARDEAGRLIPGPGVTWTSSNAAVATVAPWTGGVSVGSALGTVTGVSPGNVTITATFGSASGTAAVTVIPPPPAASVTITPESATLVVRTTRQLAAAVRDANGKVLGGRSVTWMSDNAAAATVDANGLVTGIAEGTAAVTATSAGVSDAAAITVRPELPVASVTGAAGDSHTCGLASGGAAYCWGSNGAGQLGNGTYTNTSIPVAVSGGLSFVALAAGDSHTCGLTSGGAAYCWGYNASGQLGTDATTGLNFSSFPRPAAVVGGVSFVALAAGGDHTCGLTAAGAAYCWGSNTGGQLGTGSEIGPEQCGTASSGFLVSCSPTPVAVTGGLSFVALTAGGAHTCGLTSAGAAYCWGANYQGQVGNGSNTSSSIPVPVSGGLIFSALTGGGAHTCGLTSGAAAYCWGRNDQGQLGDGSTTPWNTGISSPVPVSGSLTFSAVAGGRNHTCALSTSGGAYCWGTNGLGALGNGSSTPLYTGIPSPVAVSGGLSLVALAGGGDHTCALTSAAALYCWGSNYFGQLGNGTTWTRSRATPAAVAGGLSFVGLATLGAIAEHSCALTSAGEAYCWGANGIGQLGNGSTTDSPTPVPVSGGLSLVALAAGGSFTCGLTSGGAAYCWGANGGGQLGNGSTTHSSTPVAVAGDLRFSAIAASLGHTCALTPDGAAYCWGANGTGQLGNGSTTNSSTPVPVSGGLSFTAIAAGWGHTCALTPDGAAYCWGDNRHGALGDGSTTSSSIPVAVSGGLTYSTLAAGLLYTCGLVSGAPRCWGLQGFVSTLTLSTLAAGYQHICGLSTDGVAYCSGGEAASGDGSLATYRFSAIAAGYHHTCGLSISGGAYCWGDNSRLQLGDGIWPYATVPVLVAPFQ